MKILVIADSINFQALYGTLLGDGNIYKLKRLARSYRVTFVQKDEEYARWKAELIGVPYKAYTYNRSDSRSGKMYKSTTVVLQLPTSIKEDLYNKFYIPTKVIPIDILRSLTSEAIAVWYMDDGNMYYNGHNCHITLSTDCFSKTELLAIQDMFFTKYGINCTISDKRLRLTSRVECEKFMNLVERHIPKCMNYKILSHAIEKHKNKPKKEKTYVYPTRLVGQYSLEGILLHSWDSVASAANALGIKANAIYCNLCGKSKLCNGFKWNYI